MLEVIIVFQHDLAIFNHLDEQFWYKKIGILTIKRIAKHGLDAIVEAAAEEETDAMEEEEEEN